MMLSVLRLLALASCASALPAPAFAQDAEWPSRYVRMVVPGGSGTAADVGARLIAKHLSDRWGQQVIVENRPGAGGMAGTANIARATPDGYALLFAQGAPLSLAPHTMKTVPYDVERDLEPVIFAGLVPLVLAASGKLPVRTTAELIALAKASPGKLTFATSSARSIPHLAADLLMRKAGVQMVQVPYVGYPSAIQDTISGTVDVLMGGAQIISQGESGSLRMLGVTTDRRLPNNASIPAISETVPGYNIAGWIAVMAPRGTPQPIVGKLTGDIRIVLDIADVRARLYDLGIYPDAERFGDAAALTRFIRADTEFMKQVVQAAGIQPE